MLVLTRKHQEKIRIGEHITITVLKMKGKSVRLGIEAPAEVPVIRGELSFEGRAVEWEGVPNGSEPTAPRSVSLESPHTDRVQAHWPAKLDSVVATTRPPGNAPARVSLQRVSREQVSQVLPNLLDNGSGPLRAMLDRRSMTT
jgi:carbon storage regulator CsrA